MQRHWRQSEGFDSGTFESKSEETAEKPSKIMEIILAKNQTQEALEFLCLAEGGGEATHYEVLTFVAKEVKNRKFGTTVRAILKEEEG